MTHPDDARTGRVPGPHAATLRLGLALAVGLLVGLVATLWSTAPLAVLCGIVAMATTFDVAGLVALWPMTGEQTRRSARFEAFRPFVAELVVVGVAVASVTGIAILMLVSDSGTRDAAAAIGLAGVFTSWSMLHLMYATRYADLYFTEPVGGIDFNDDATPAYRDFLYVSFTLGMTYAVSDTNVSTTAFRSVVLRHTLLSYLFGTVILAATINLVAGIVTG